MRARAFAQVDVFGDGPCSGNPVAVVLDAEGLDDEELQRFARWTDLSETTFVLPPAAAGADYRVRIFTPSRELAFAGHPTLGTCHAWLEHGGRGLEVGEGVVQECGAGLVCVRRTTGGRLAFAAPPLQRSGPVEDDVRAEVLRSLQLGDDDVVDMVWADNGPGWVAVLLGSADAVLRLRPTQADLDIGVVGPTREGEAEALELRAFFPAGAAMLEDPVTGSLNASVADWLLDTGRVEAPYVARQGTALGRRGRVHVERGADGTTWVGGATTTVLAGTAAL